MQDLTQFLERENVSGSDSLIIRVAIIQLLARLHTIFIDFFLVRKTPNFIQNKEDQHKFFKPENKSSSNLIIILGCYEILFLLN